MALQRRLNGLLHQRRTCAFGHESVNPIQCQRPAHNVGRGQCRDDDQCRAAALAHQFLKAQAFFHAWHIQVNQLRIDVASRLHQAQERSGVGGFEALRRPEKVADEQLDALAHQSMIVGDQDDTGRWRARRDKS